MALTKIGSIGINTGIAFAGVTTIATLNASDNVLSVGGTVNFVSDVSIGGTVSIAGTLTYEDVTNVDAVGLITARDGIKVGSGITLSKDGDIFATGITTISENLKVGTGVTLSPDGDGFYTGVVTATSYRGDGSNLTGISADVVDDTSPQLGGNLEAGTRNIDFDDNGKLRLGTGNDLQLFHDGTDSIVKDTRDSGTLRIHADSIAFNDKDVSETMLLATADGSVDLRFNGNKKIETTNTGAVVTGICTATSFSGIGAITMVDSWGLTSGSNLTNEYVTSNWTRRTGTHGGNIGNAMTESSGVFTFPQSGLYYMSAQFGLYAVGGTQSYGGIKVHLSTNGGSSYSNVSDSYTSMQNTQYASLSHQELFDVTDASQFKIKFQTDSVNTMSVQGGQGRTSLIFVRYGDT